MTGGVIVSWYPRPISDAAQCLEGMDFGRGCGECEPFVLADGSWHRRVDQCVERVVSELGEHRSLLIGVGADVALLISVVCHRDWLSWRVWDQAACGPSPPLSANLRDSHPPHTVRRM